MSIIQSASDTSDSGFAFEADTLKLILMGSFASGGIVAHRSQICCDQDISTRSVIFNTPLLCGYLISLVIFSHLQLPMNNA